MKITPKTILDCKVGQPNDLPIVMGILDEAAVRLKEIESGEGNHDER